MVTREFLIKPEFADPFKLHHLCLTVDEGTKIPAGLIEKSKRCQ